MLVGSPEIIISQDDQVVPVIISHELASPEDTIVVVEASQSARSEEGLVDGDVEFPLD